MAVQISNTWRVVYHKKQRLCAEHTRTNWTRHPRFLCRKFVLYGHCTVTCIPLIHPSLLGPSYMLTKQSRVNGVTSTRLGR